MQVVPLDLKSDEQELKAFNARMDDLYAIDLTFLQGFDQATLAYLAEVRHKIPGQPSTYANLDHIFF
jgi:hypothetical protein